MIKSRRSCKLCSVLVCCHCIIHSPCVINVKSHIFTCCAGTDSYLYISHFSLTVPLRCGPVRHGNSQCFIAFSVTPNLALNSCGVGPNCMLCPTLTDSTINSAKFVVVLLDKKALEVFRGQMVSMQLFPAYVVYFVINVFVQCVALSSVLHTPPFCIYYYPIIPLFYSIIPFTHPYHRTSSHTPT